MKKYISLLCLSLLPVLGMKVSAQIYCDEFDPLTFQHTNSVWDWRDNTPSNWQAYYKVKPGFNTFVGNQLPFPFRPQSGQPSPNVSHLNVFTSGFDHEPSDGWELVFKNFGGNSFVEAVENPTFVLYNRFKGILRVFIWLTVDQTNLLNEAGVEIQFNRQDAAAPIGSGLFSLVPSPVQSLQATIKSGFSATPNSYSNSQGGEWLFADVPMAYDPCTCNYSQSPTGAIQANVSIIRTSGRLGQNSTFTTTDMNGQTEPIDSSGYKSFASAASSIEKGTKFLKSTLGLFAEVNKQTGKTTVEPIAGDSSYVIKTTQPIKLPTWIKVLPYVGDVFVVLDALVTGGQNDNVSSAQTATPTKVSFSGDMGLTGPILPMDFYNPGSKHNDASFVPNPDQKLVPVYDHVLGIFNLLETPVLEWTSYSHSTGGNNLSCTGGVNGQLVPFEFPEIRQYHLKHPIKYVINPASELELVSLDASIVYEIGNNPLDESIPVNGHVKTGSKKLAFYGPVSLVKSPATIGYPRQLANSGIELDIWPKANPADPNSSGINDMRKLVYSTGFYPATCLQQQSILLAFPLGNGHFAPLSFQPVFRLKIRAVFKRTDQDADEDTEAVVWMASFDVDIEPNQTSGGQNYYLNGPQASINHNCIDSEDGPQYLSDYFVSQLNSTTSSQSGFFPMGTNGLPLDLSFEGAVIEFSQEALRSISVVNSLVRSELIPPPPNRDPEEFILGPPIILRAGNSVDISYGPGSSSIYEDVTVEIGLPSRFQECDDLPLLSPVSWSDVNAFCQNPTKYNPNIARLADMTVDSIPSIPLSAFPNPFTSELLVRYELAQEAEASIVLIDMMGRTVQEILPGNHRKAGPHEMQVDLSELPAGMYTLVMQAGDTRQTLKVIRQ